MSESTPAAPRSADAVVIGGGPGGSAAAGFLARAGLDVVVVEKEEFPRFQIGESLLPYSLPVLERLGAWDAIEAHGFQEKHGARFLFEPGGEIRRVEFANGLDRSVPMALQVRRAEFDRILLDHAVASGADLVPDRVSSVLIEGERAVGVELAGGGKVKAPLVVDASGRATLIGSQLGLKRRDPVLRQAALFTHFRGVRTGEGIGGGDLLVIGTAVGWFWIIPLGDDQASVGLVCPARVMKERGERDLATFFDDLMRRSPEIWRRVEGAERLRPVEPRADFSYRLERFTGPGWATVGDASAFLDPVFSSGVHVALASAEKVAEVRLTAGGRLLETDDFRAYDRWLDRGLRRLRRYVLGFYDPAFVNTFSSDPPFELVRRGVVTVLAGRFMEADPRLWLVEAFMSAGIARDRRLIEKGEIEIEAPACDATEPPRWRFGLGA